MPNELRLFISSTFRDLQEEREHLVKKIFPEIRALCRERGITFTEIDLRWGLTEQDVALGQVIRACLDEVDRCRPYFIGITGSRYGYVPSYLDIQKDPDLLARYPWIDDAVIEEMSITEMEAHYALLGVGRPGIDKPAADRARFYVQRHRRSFEEEHREDPEWIRLQEYRSRIEQSGAPIESFRDPVSLGEIVYDDLVEIIERDFAESRPPSPLDEERTRHAAFSLSRRRSYIANPASLRMLDEHVAGDGPPLILSAPSGIGKSSLLAFWADRYNRRHPESPVIEHYVGIGATATDHYGVIRHICMELVERLGIDREIPSDPNGLAGAFGEWITAAGEMLAEKGERIVLLLDGLDQLSGKGGELWWIPDVIPASVRLIVSSTLDDPYRHLTQRRWQEATIDELTEAEREALVVRYLAEFRKSLDPEQIARLVGSEKCSHPLFLTTLLEELRLVGRHEQLDDAITDLLAAESTDDLFRHLLARLEDDYSQRVVRSVLSTIAVAANGLDEREIAEITRLSNLTVAAMVAGLDYHLVRKGGRLSFFHNYLARAVDHRYLADRDTAASIRRDVVRYFDDREPTERSLSELVHQLRALDETDRLADIVTDLENLTLLEAGYLLVETCGYLIDRGLPITDIFREKIAALDRAKTDDTTLYRRLESIAHLLENLGQLEGAEEVIRTLLRTTEETGDRAAIAKGELLLANLRRRRGDLAEAMERLERSRRILEEIGDTEGIARTDDNIGMVHHFRGSYEAAETCYRSALATHTELQNENGIATVAGHLGILLTDTRRFEQAEEQFRLALALTRKLGNKRSEAATIGNIGALYTDRGDQEQALVCYNDALAIHEKTGDRGNIASIYGNIGIIYYRRGDFDRTLDYYRRALTMHEELGELRSVAQMNGNIGGLLMARGEYAEADPYFVQSEAEALSLGNLREAGRVQAIRGDIAGRIGEPDRALALFLTAIGTHTQIGAIDRVREWWLGIARLLLDLLDRNKPVPESTVAAIYALDDLPPEAGSITGNPTDDLRRLVRFAVDREIELRSEDEPSSFLAELLSARLMVHEGEPDAAADCLQRLLDETEKADDHAMRSDHLGEGYLHLWRITGDPSHRERAWEINEELYKGFPLYEYVERRGVMGG